MHIEQAAVSAEKIEVAIRNEGAKDDLRSYWPAGAKKTINSTLYVPILNGEIYLKLKAEQ